MNSDTLTHEIILGEFSKQQSDTDVVFLPCKIGIGCILECILQDKFGRTISTTAHSVDESTDSLSIDISKCTSGDYHAWIFINEMTFVRQLKVVKKEQSGFLGQFVKMFS
jgi:hypothetical protein